MMQTHTLLSTTMCYTKTHHQFTPQFVQLERGRRRGGRIARSAAADAAAARDESERCTSIATHIFQLPRERLHLGHGQAQLLLLLAEQRPDRVEVITCEWDGRKRGGGCLSGECLKHKRE